MSHYLVAEIVGEEQWKKNIRALIAEVKSANGWKTLDDVATQERGLPVALGVTNDKSYYEVHALARALLDLGTFSSDRPAGQPLFQASSMSRYLDPRVVGEEWARKNIADAVKETLERLEWRSLDDVHAGQPALATVLGVASTKSGTTKFGYSVPELAKALFSAGYLVEPPYDSGPLLRSGRSNYINPGIVGEVEARQNAGLELTRRFCSVTAAASWVRQSLPFKKVLGLPAKSTSGEVAERLAALGFFPPDEQTLCDVSFSRRLPDIFTEARGRTLARTMRPVGARTVINGPPIVFLKGETFEQLVGLSLSAMFPEDSIISQCCLRVDPTLGTFGVRADFKVAKRVYEVKWGNHLENMRETVSKHRPLLNGTDLTYHLVTRNAASALEVDVGHPTIALSDLLSHRNMPADLGMALSAVDRAITTLVAENSTGSLLVLRDFLYSTIREANAFSGKSRLLFLASRLMLALSTSRDRSDDSLKASTLCRYRPLEAHFEYNGVVYETFVSPQVLVREEPESYRTVWLFDDLEFSVELARDAAVVFELSKEMIGLGTIHDYLSFEETNGVCSTVIALPGLQQFRVGEDGSGVRSIEDLVARANLHFEDGNLEFGCEYLRTFGNAAG